MTEAIDTVQPAATAPIATAGAHTVSFHDVLSALNPLQYLPVVGSIYRAMTGDTVAEPLRVGGALVAGLLMGGPIGMAISAAGTAAQKLLGIDPDAISRDMLAAVGIDPAPAVAAAGPAPEISAAQRSAALAAYGLHAERSRA